MRSIGSPLTFQPSFFVSAELPFNHEKNECKTCNIYILRNCENYVIVHLLNINDILGG